LSKCKRSIGKKLRFHQSAPGREQVSRSIPGEL
jgi:hypothetical protein